MVPFFQKYGFFTRTTPEAKDFYVLASANAQYAELSTFLTQDSDGVQRLHTTIDAAVGVCVANRGDVIHVLPGHTETLSSATALALDVAGITIVGHGTGSLRPTITMDTATTTTIPVSAANITVKNLVFTMNFADIVSVFTLTTAAYFRVEDCLITATATNMNVLYVIDTNTTTAAADGLTLLRNKWISPDAATVSMIKADGTNDSWVINDNYAQMGAAASGGALAIIAAGKVLTNVEIARNKFNVTTGDLAGVAFFITTNGSTNSGIISNNYIQHTDTTGEVMVTASSGFSFFENRASGVAGATGYVLPAVDT